MFVLIRVKKFDLEGCPQILSEEENARIEECRVAYLGLRSTAEYAVKAKCESEEQTPDSGVILKLRNASAFYSFVWIKCELNKWTEEERAAMKNNCL